MVNYKYYNYKDTEEDLTNKPANTHLIIELNTNEFYFVKITTQVELYHFNITTGVETQIDIDPSNSSGDNKSRDHKIQSLWHDKDNSIIWGVDCDNDGTADDFDVWKLDYSVSKTSPTVTEIGTSGGADANSVYAQDIFIIGSDVFVINTEERTGDPYFVAWEVDTAPFTEEDTLGFEGDSTVDFFFGVVINDKYYCFWNYIGEFDVNSLEYDDSITTLTLNNTLTAGYSRSSNINLNGIVYDGIDLLYFIVEKQTDSLNYLIIYSINGDSYTILSEYNIALMLDRNVYGTIPPFMLEKGFHLTEDKIYQIPTTYLGRLNLVSLFPFTDTIIAITDHFVIDNSGNVYEMVDLIGLHYFSHLFLNYWKEDYPSLETEFRRDQFTVSKNLFMQIIGKLTASYSNRLFKGLYNFKNNGVGSPPVNFDNAVATVIADNWQYHGRILELTRSGSNPIIEQSFSEVQTNGTIEFYMGSDDVTPYSHARIYDGGSMAIILTIKGEKITYHEGGAYHDICDAADDILYRIRVDFECGGDAYEGLLADTFFVYVNETKYGPYPFNVAVDHVDKIYFTCNTAAVYKFYIDALDYSWNTEFNIGDNRYVEEGESDYSKQIFKGTYNFEDETVGTSGTDIGFVDSIAGTDADCSVSIIDLEDNHQYILKLTDDNAAGVAQINHTLSTGETSGDFEFWIKVESGYVGDFLMIIQDISYVVQIQLNMDIDGGNWDVKDNGGWNPNLGSCSDDTWHHVRYNFNQATPTCTIYIDGDSIGTFTPQNSNNTARIRFTTDNGGVGDAFIDAFGESWDSAYTVGDNNYVEEGEPNQVVFEGIVDKYDGHKEQMALVLNQGSEMDEVEPSGEFTVDTDGLISGIISGFHDYITEGTLQDGADLATIILQGNKKSRKYFNQVKDVDGYTWALQTQGVLDYDSGGVVSDVDLQYDGTHVDKIWDVDVVPLSSGTNQVIVKGALNPATGVLYTGTWNDEADQLANGIHKIIIVDASLNSDALCLTKATAIGTRESGNYLSVQCMFGKPLLGVIYPHQTLIFQYISTDVSISEAEYIIDGIGLDLLRDECFLQASAGLIFEYEAIEKELPEENSQKIEQNSGTLVLISTRLKGEWVPAEGIRAPGLKPASYVSHGISGAWEFSDELVANEEMISGNFKFKDDMDLSKAPIFCIGWSSPIVDSDCYWQLEYLYTSLDESTIAAAQETLLTAADQRTSSSVPNGLIISSFTLQVPSSTDVCLHFRITRRSASAEDTIVGNVNLLGIVLWYYADIIGTS